MDDSFGAWVKKTRERRGLTIAACAAKAQISWPRWKRIEQEEPARADGLPPQLRRKTVEAVAAALGVPTGEALQQAGYSPLESSKNQPSWYSYYTDLPPRIRKIVDIGIGAQIEALWRAARAESEDRQSSA